MLDFYLNQTALLEVQIGTDDRGAALYAAPVTLACRRQSKTVTAYGNQAQTVTPQTVYYSARAVHIGDKLDGKTVLSVDEWAGLDGGLEGYKAVV